MIKLNNDFMKLVVETGDETFVVEAISKTQGEANILCELNPSWGVIAETKDGLILLANVQPRKTVKVRFEDGDFIVTDINGTVKSIREYYLGKEFNIGKNGNDNMQKAVHVEFLK